MRRLESHAATVGVADECGSCSLCSVDQNVRSCSCNLTRCELYALALIGMEVIASDDPCRDSGGQRSFARMVFEWLMDVPGLIAALKDPWNSNQNLCGNTLNASAGCQTSGCSSTMKRLTR